MEISGMMSSDNLSPTSQYDLIVRQQPLAARACGNGTRDRRVIDPPPILQVIIRDPDISPAEIDLKKLYPLNIVYCELWDAITDGEEETGVSEIRERRQQDKLVGTLVAMPFVGRDESDVEGCFFPFPDLSCRTPGRYRLKFILVVLNPADMKLGQRLPFKATAMSQSFEVYTAKTFPGMKESTRLTKRLKEQGCPISIKKGHQRADGMGDTCSEEEAEEERSPNGGEGARGCSEVASLSNFHMSPS